jgi:hypothetical protein
MKNLLEILCATDVYIDGSDGSMWGPFRGSEWESIIKSPDDLGNCRFVKATDVVKLVNQINKEHEKK